MHSTGEVMGMGSNFGEAFLKSQLGAGQVLPQGGKLFLSVNDRDKPYLPEVADNVCQAWLPPAGNARHGCRAA